MRTVHVCICLPDDYSEFPAEDVEDAEMAIESLVSTALAEVFNTVLVENVIVQNSSRPGDERER